MLVLIMFWKQLHTNPRRQALLVVNSCIKQEDVVEMDAHWNTNCFKYNLSSKLRKINIHMQKKKKKTQKTENIILS